MFFFVYKQARLEIGRVLMTVLAVALVIAEILVLEGFLVGLYAQLRSAVLDRGGDLIVAQSGISNFIAARSTLPQLSRLQVEEVDGVEATHPITALAAIYDRDGRKTPIFVVVHDGFGGPKKIVAGGPVTGDREIVIDRSLALKYGFSVGDPIVLSDFEFTIAGISANSAAFFTPFAFITYDDLVATGPQPNYSAFGADPGTVYVSNVGNGTISEVDLYRGIVRRNLVAGAAPEHMAINRTAGAIYAADADAGLVAELSLSTGAELRVFDIGDEIHGLDLSDDGQHLFVAGKESDTLAAEDLGTGRITKAALAPTPYHLTTIPGTGTIFVSSRDEPKVWIVDSATLTPRSDFAIEGEGHQMVALP